jgi:hypothetical protein
MKPIKNFIPATHPSIWEAKKDCEFTLILAYLRRLYFKKEKNQDSCFISWVGIGNISLFVSLAKNLACTSSCHTKMNKNNNNINNKTKPLTADA